MQQPLLALRVFLPFSHPVQAHVIFIDALCLLAKLNVLVIEKAQEDMVFLVLSPNCALRVDLEPLEALRLVTEAVLTEEKTPAVEALVPNLIDVPVTSVARVASVNHACVFFVVLILVSAFALVI